MEGSGVHKHGTLTTRSRPLLDGIKWVCLCACACICVKMCAYLQHVSMCRGTLAPADKEIMSVSPPIVTSCPPTPGVFLTRLSYWLLVILIHFHLCLPACLPTCRPACLRPHRSPRPLSILFSAVLSAFHNCLRWIFLFIPLVSAETFHLSLLLLLPSKLQMRSFD